MARWAPQLPVGARVLDLAAGSGRHARWLCDRGHAVTALDRNADALAGLAATAGHDRIETWVADLEDGPWPLGDRQWDLVLVCNYLWRPRLPLILDAVAPGGWLIYETFSRGQAMLGRPRRPEFLLEPGELLELVRGRMRVLAYEEGRLTHPLREVQRLVAHRQGGGDAPNWILPANPDASSQGTLPDTD